MRRPWKLGVLVLGAVLFVSAAASLYIADRGGFIAKLWSDAQSRNVSYWELLTLAFGADSYPDVSQCLITLVFSTRLH